MPCLNGRFGRRRAPPGPRPRSAVGTGLASAIAGDLIALNILLTRTGITRPPLFRCALRRAGGALISQSLTTTIYSFGIPPEVTLVVKALVVITVSLLQSERFQQVFRRRSPR